MFSNFPKSRATIVASDGSVRAETDVIFAGTIIVITDPKIPVKLGDEIRRKLPSGLEEVFQVTDPQFFDSFGGLSAHYQVKFTRKGQFQAGKGGHYINVSGSNARVNIESIDHSTNIAVDNRVFSELRATIEKKVEDSKERIAILESLARLEKAADYGGQSTAGEFGIAYQNFIATAANHMTLIAPFIPTLTKML